MEKSKTHYDSKEIAFAQYYANIKTYIKTCYRNNINPTDALIRLMNDNPYSVQELFKAVNSNLNQEEIPISMQ